MHISRIVIHGFRNFSDLDLSDLPPSNVLVGENGTGKTNLLFALRLVLDPSLPDSSRLLSAEDFWDGYVQPFHGEEIEVSVELSDFDADLAAMALLADHLVYLGPNVARLTYAYRPRPLAEDPASESDYEFVIYGADDPDQRVGREVLRYVSLRVLPALRDAESDLSSARSPLRRLLARVDLDPEQVALAQDHLADAADALLADDGVNAINTGITNRLENMVGDVFGVATTLGIAPADAAQIARSIRLLIDEAKQRTISQASLGTANLLYLALLLEQIAAQEAAGEIVATILAVEEPEAHLHPHLQRVLFRHLLADGRPLVVTTHSPHLASVAPLASITLLRDVGGETGGFHTRFLGLDDRTEADIERYLDVTRAEMLFAKGVILVEGSAEEFLVPAFASAMGFDLDAHGVSVCSVRGTDFAPYRALLGENGLNIPNVVITDGDPDDHGVFDGLTRGCRLVGDQTAAEAAAAVQIHDLAGARHALASEGIFVGDRTLELDLIPECLQAMADAYAELEPSVTKQGNFDNDLTSFEQHGTRADAILRRLDKLGKGRFAQRLANYVDGGEPPSHVWLAIERMRLALAPDE